MTGIILVLLTAFTLVLSFPSFDLTFLAWFALVPFFLATRGRRLAAVAGLSCLAGIAFFMAVFSWINAVKGVNLLHFFLMGVYLGLYFLVFGFFLHLLSARGKLPFILAAPALWVCVEYLRSHVGAFGLPLALLGHTQYQNLPLIQMASYTGAYGVSFVVVLVNAAIADLLIYFFSASHPALSREGGGRFVSSPLFRGAFVLAVILGLLAWGWQAIRQELSGIPLSIAVVQGNIPPDQKWKREHRDQILSKYETLSEEVLKSGPRLIVWPEASTPGFVLKEANLYSQLFQIIRRFKTHVVLGSAEYPKFSKTKVKFGKSGNTALHWSPEGKVVGQYIKIRLVPFGEHVPYEGKIPWPDFIVAPSTNSHIPGTELVLFEIDGKKFGTLICSEMMYPELSRGMVEKGATFLLNISNEGWFGENAFPYQFLSACVFRAVENRVNVVRSTNTGVSGFIDPFGRITARVSHAGKDIFVEGTLVREILISPSGAFYTRHGDLFAYGCVAFGMALVIWSFVIRRLRPRATKQ